MASITHSAEASASADATDVGAAGDSTDVVAIDMRPHAGFEQHPTDKEEPGQ